MTTATPTKPKANDNNDETTADTTAETAAQTTLAADVRRLAVESTFAVVGITDIAVERIKDATGKLQDVRNDISSRTVKGELAKLQQTVVSLPTSALEKSTHAAERAEETLGGLATRGRGLVDRVTHQEATQALLEQVNYTVSRGKAAFTATKNGAEDIAESAKDVVEGTAEVVSESVTKTTETAKKATKRTAKTASKRAATAKSAAKGAATSAKRTTKAAAEAVADAAELIGDDELTTEEQPKASK